MAAYDLKIGGELYDPITREWRCEMAKVCVRAVSRKHAISKGIKLAGKRYPWATQYGAEFDTVPVPDRELK